MSGTLPPPFHSTLVDILLQRAVILDPIKKMLQSNTNIFDEPRIKLIFEKNPSAIINAIQFLHEGGEITLLYDDKTHTKLAYPDPTRRGMLKHVFTQQGLNAQDIDGNTPLMMCVQLSLWPYPRTAEIEFLLWNNANLKIQNNQGDNVLHLIAKAGSVFALELILKKPDREPDLTTLTFLLNTQNHEGRTPLMEAAKAGAETILATLLSYPQDYLIQDKEGRNAVHLAVLNGYPKAFQLLAQREARLLNQIDLKHYDALACAVLQTIHSDAKKAKVGASILQILFHHFAVKLDFQPLALLIKFFASDSKYKQNLAKIHAKLLTFPKLKLKEDEVAQGFSRALHTVFGKEAPSLSARSSTEIRTSIHEKTRRLQELCEKMGSLQAQISEINSDNHSLQLSIQRLKEKIKETQENHAMLQEENSLKLKQFKDCIKTKLSETQVNIDALSYQIQTYSTAQLFKSTPPSKTIKEINSELSHA